jgi:hypothetical protein
MKQKMIIYTLIAMVIVAAILFIAYDFLYVSIDYDGLFIGKTVSESGLFHLDQFSWYNYDQIRYPSSTVHIGFEFCNTTYNGSPAKLIRESYTYTNYSGYNISNINERYFDDTGATLLANSTLLLVNGTLIKSNYFNNSVPGEYHKSVLGHPLLNFAIAPRGVEDVTVGNKTYICKKYYLPSQITNGSGSFKELFWFNDSIPVPVKIYEIEQNVTFELIDWG